MSKIWTILWRAALLVVFFTPSLCVTGAEPNAPPASPLDNKASSADGSGDRAKPSDGRASLSRGQWSRIDRAIDRGLQFIARHQGSDGSFETQDAARPGVTGLCVLAMLARGHQPGKGRYGAQIERAVDYTLDLQDPNSGVIVASQYIGPEQGDRGAAHYDHGIAGVMLAEVYGMTDAKRHDRIRAAINSALRYTRRIQTKPKGDPNERGGWRYQHYSWNNSDLSVTCWQLMFYRAARNAEFNVPAAWVDEAMAYVHRSFDKDERAFVYALTGKNRYTTRGMVGAGIVCLELGGEHHSETSRQAADWILKHSFSPYNNFRHVEDRYHYGAFYCSQAMFQLGGDHWKRFFPTVLEALTDAQHADGSWDVESTGNDDRYGNVYTTALAVLTLATPYQLLPIYQR
jgi:hypothetical protein